MERGKGGAAHGDNRIEFSVLQLASVSAFRHEKLKGLMCLALTQRVKRKSRNRQEIVFVTDRKNGAHYRLNV